MKHLFIVFLFLLPLGFVLAEEKIDINTAPVEDLLKIIHIGEARALELISLRPFSSLDDLARIKGIGEKRIEDIKNQGLAWVAPAAEKPADVGFPPVSLITTDVAEDGPPQILIDYPAGVIINEIMPSPAGPDDQEEWIEIFNKNNFGVDLSGWKITDIDGKIEVYTFPEETIIISGGFLVLSRPTTKITLNNQGDRLKLIQLDGNMVDEVNYENAPREESYGFFDSGWAWVSNPTPGSTNVFPTPPAAAQKEKITENIPPQAIMAAAGESLQLAQSNKAQKSPIVIPAALILAIFSGAVIFLLKRKLPA